MDADRLTADHLEHGGPLERRSDRGDSLLERIHHTGRTRRTRQVGSCPTTSRFDCFENFGVGRLVSWVSDGRPTLNVV